MPDIVNFTFLDAISNICSPVNVLELCYEMQLCGNSLIFSKIICKPCQVGLEEMLGLTTEAVSF